MSRANPHIVDIPKMLALLKQGLNTVQTAKAMGVTTAAIRYRIDKLRASGEVIETPGVIPRVRTKQTAPDLEKQQRKPAKPRPGDRFDIRNYDRFFEGV